MFERLNYPQPRVEAGLLLRKAATSAIDISDGLLADLGHILSASGVGAQINVDAVPRSPAFKACEKEEPGTDDCLNMVLSGGDDYELCFTIPADRCVEIEARFETIALNITSIGEIEAASGLRCVLASGDTWEPLTTGFQHFGSGQ